MEVKSIVVAIISVAAASLPIIVAYVLPRWPKGTKQVKIAQAEEELAKPKEQGTRNKEQETVNRNKLDGLNMKNTLRTIVTVDSILYIYFYISSNAQATKTTALILGIAFFGSWGSLPVSGLKLTTTQRELGQPPRPKGRGL